MDENQALQMYATTNQTMDGRSCVELLPYIEFEETELHNREMEVFQLRLQLICASHEFKVAMFRDYGRKSIKPFLMRYWLYDDTKATSTANKLNEAHRVFQNFAQITKNCFKCPHVKIFRLDMHELYLAKNMTWVIKQSVDIKPASRTPPDVPIPIDAGSVEDSVQAILASDWYRDARDNPFLVANILKNITSRVINDSVYRAGTR